ncbi:cysteine hydrolase family protein [Paraburkholderia sp. JHI869]|uniref:cysteine hydrolase family protein n=1 Tax=Paraburkholderia sp. JHI869 TaxID=3112959 RepID=UPI00316C8A0F
MKSDGEYSFELGSSENNKWRVSESEIDLSVSARPTRKIRLAAEPKNIVLDTSRSAIVVIDMQNDFCSKEGRVDRQGGDISKLRGPIAGLNQILPVFRDWGSPVIWVNWGLRPDLANSFPTHFNGFKKDASAIGPGESYSDESGRALVAGSWDSAITEGLAPQPGDMAVDKYRVSAFWDTPLDSMLRNHKIDTVFFAGVNIDQCVLHSLVDAHCLGYNCVLLADCSATTSPDFCVEATCYNVKRCFGFVSNAVDILKADISL